MAERDTSQDRDETQPGIELPAKAATPHETAEFIAKLTTYGRFPTGVVTLLLENMVRAAVSRIRMQTWASLAVREAEIRDLQRANTRLRRRLAKEKEKQSDVP